MKDLRNIIADNKRVAEKATKDTLKGQTVVIDNLGATNSCFAEAEDNAITLVGRLVQVDQSLDEYAGMIGRVLKPANLENEVVVDQSLDEYAGMIGRVLKPANLENEVIVNFTNSPFVNAQVKGEYLDEVSEQVMDLFPLDEL